MALTSSLARSILAYMLIFVGLIWCHNGFAQLRVAPYVQCQQKGGVYLSVKNIGGQDVKIKKSQAPWLPSSSALVLSLAISDGKGKFVKLPKDNPIWDTFYDPDIVFKPGEIKSGFLSFGLLIKDFFVRNKDGDILIGYTASGEKFVASSGYILVPKQRWFSNACPSVLFLK